VTKSRLQTIILAALVIAGVTIAVRQWPSSTVDQTGAPTTPGAGGQTASADNTVGDVRLESLDQREEGRGVPSRNLFRFETRRVASAEPTAPRRRAVAPVAVDAGPPGPALPPAPPPIPLRYIGYLDQPGQVPRVAVLSDGRGNVFNGKEGDIIEGRYRVLRIGTDSADLIYVDGRGRQTIRLSGQ
jgi:hypothetical protein